MLADVAMDLTAASWAEELAVLLGGLDSLFARREPREVFADLVEGLLAGWTAWRRLSRTSPRSRSSRYIVEAEHR